MSMRLSVDPTFVVCLRKKSGLGSRILWTSVSRPEWSSSVRQRSRDRVRAHHNLHTSNPFPPSTIHSRFLFEKRVLLRLFVWKCYWEGTGTWLPSRSHCSSLESIHSRLEFFSQFYLGQQRLDFPLGSEILHGPVS